MRFKPPPRNTDIGWRVEFRSMDIQLTDFENAAFSVFVVLLTRAILHFNLDLYMPLSQVDRNMQTAHSRRELDSKFHFRNVQAESTETSLLTINEIMNGHGACPGLVDLVDYYLHAQEKETLDDATRRALREMTDVIRRKANGSLKTGAQYIRNFVQTHSAYKRDSVVSEEIARDLLLKIKEMNKVQFTHQS